MAEEGIEWRWPQLSFEEFKQSAQQAVEACRKVRAVQGGVSSNEIWGGGKKTRGGCACSLFILYSWVRSWVCLRNLVLSPVSCVSGFWAVTV